MAILMMAFLLDVNLWGQLSGTILDENTKEPLPFATIRVDNGKRSLLTDLEGRFDIPDLRAPASLDITYLGYLPLRYTFNGNAAPGLKLYMSINPGQIDEVWIRPPYEKIRYIMEKAIANKAMHKPDNYPAYSCHVYQKTIADIKWTDTMRRARKEDSSQTFLGALANSHLLFSETSSNRTYKKAQKIKEEIVASRVSGFKKAPFITLITDVLPFDAYGDYISLNGKDYANPIAKGWSSRYEVDLVDEVMQGSDTLYILSYRPKAKLQKADLLQGQVYISTKQFAIAYFIGHNRNPRLDRTSKIEHQYQYIEGKWFPQNLNYEIVWNRYLKDKQRNNIPLVIRGHSVIDSVRFDMGPNPPRFDNAKTVIVADKALERSDSSWNDMRSEPLTTKEKGTYLLMDSLYEELKIERFVPFMEKLSEAKIPVSVVDISLDRLYTYNKHEHNRYGLGLQTNEKISPWASIGGWFGYGSFDKAWKYGGFVEAYLDPYHETSIRAGYNRDLTAPGRMFLNKEVGNAYIQSFFMDQADQVDESFIKVHTHLGYFDGEAGFAHTEQKPLYTYRFGDPATLLERVKIDEGSLSLRYAFAEKRMPVFQRYQGLGTRYPIFYASVRAGRLATDNGHRARFAQALLGLSWKKHVNRIGNERLLLMAGGVASDDALPLQRLLTAWGTYEPGFPVRTFGGFQTLGLTEIYMDRFASLCWEHAFDWKVLNIKDRIVPYLGIAHNVLLPHLGDKHADYNPGLLGPPAVFQETGLLVHDLLKLNYLNLANLNLDLGIFHRWGSLAWDSKFARVVIGLSFSL